MRNQRFVLILVLLFVGGCAGSQELRQPVPPTGTEINRPAPAAAADLRPPVLPATNAPLPLDPSFTVGQLDNGLRYLIRRNGRPENRAAIWLAVNVGSVLEDDDQRGLAHFVEHMAFNGSRDFDKLQMVDYLESIGMRFGPDVNAYTGFDETVYMLEVPTDDPVIMDKALLILENWASHVTLDATEIDNERGVVAEELRQGRGAAARIRDQQFPVLFPNSRYADRLPIGLESVIRGSDAETLRRFYREWYRPELMAVIAVGDFDPVEMESRIRDQFSILENPPDARSRTVYPVPPHEETLVTIVSDPEATMTDVTVYQKLPTRPDLTEADFRRSIVEALYHGMLNLRLNEIRQKPGAPFLFAGSGSGAMVRSSDVLLQRAGVREGEVVAGLGALLTEAERVRRHGFAESELERARTSVLRSFEQAYEERDKTLSTAYANEALSHFLTGASMPGIELTVDMVQRLIPEISLQEVNRLAVATAGASSRVIAVSGPEREAEPLADESALLQVFEEVTARDDIDPWLDRTLDQPLVAAPPRPGTVLDERTIEALGVTEWKLSNGVTVVLKPTDFKNDEILVSGTSPGGHSLVDDADHTSAVFATSLMSVSGVGAFDQVQLGKALTGKIASAAAGISETSESVSGRASPKDLETLFQLLYLRMTEPRLDTDAVESFIEQFSARLENRDAQPTTVFYDRVGEKWNQDHVRRRPITKDQLEEIDPSRALAIYQERFADAGDFQFAIVGNFELDAIRPLVTTWLGGLPSTGRDENWKDVGVRHPDGVVEVEVSKGLEAKSQVDIRFHGESAWSPQQDHDLSSLAEALTIRLREVLREEMGGVYGVRVSGGLSRVPRETYVFTIGFGCAPENVASLEAAVFEEIERAKREGLDAALIAKVQEAQRRSYETNLRDNGFWLSELLGHYRDGTDPTAILSYGDLVDSVTSDRLRDAARTYLDTGRVLIGRLFPE